MKIQALITDFRIISEKDVEKKEKIKISFGERQEKTIILNRDLRNVYLIKEDLGGISVIEILESDDISDIYFLEVDEENNLYLSRSNSEEIQKKDNENIINDNRCVFYSYF